jgi:hypothetical protein
MSLLPFLIPLIGNDFRLFVKRYYQVKVVDLPGSPRLG